MSINIKKVDNKVIIEADLDGTGLSGTGKSVVLATTNGFMPVPEDDTIKVSLNIITPRKRR